MNLLRLGSGAVIVIALIFDIVALVAPRWKAFEIIYLIGGSGLRQSSTGDKITQRTAEKVVIAFVVLAMEALLASAVLVLWAARSEGIDQTGRIGGGLAIVAAFLILIGMATYTGLRRSVVSGVSIPWGYSYALAWVAFCLALIGGLVAWYGS